MSTSPGPDGNRAGNAKTLALFRSVVKCHLHHEDHAHSKHSIRRRSERLAFSQRQLPRSATAGKRDEIRSFTAETVLSFTNDLSKRGVSSNTIISKLGALKTLAQFCMALKDDRSHPRLSENPARAFPWPEPVRTETKFMHPVEL